MVVLFTREEKHECWGSCLITTDALLDLSESFSFPFPSTFFMALKFPQQQTVTSILNSLIFLGMKEACKSFEHTQPWKFSLVIQGECFGFLSELPFKNSWWIELVFRATVGFCWRGLVKLPQGCQTRGNTWICCLGKVTRIERSFQCEATLASPSFPPWTVFSASAFQPHWPHFCAWKRLCFLLPQDLCSCAP